MKNFYQIFSLCISMDQYFSILRGFLPSLKFYLYSYTYDTFNFLQISNDPFSLNCR